MNRSFGVSMLVSMSLALLVPALPAAADDMKSEGAWCGGSWTPGTVDESGKVVDRGGVNFAKCVPVVKKIGGKDMAVPTHPATPARQVILQRDAQGHWVGGTMQSGKFMLIPRRIVPRH